MNNTKDIFSEALDPANEYNWVPILKAQTNDNRTDIYRIYVPGKSVQILKASVLELPDTEWGRVSLEPDVDWMPRMDISTSYIEQYCPAPTLPTETFAEIYNVEAAELKSVIRFAHMTLDSNGDWIGVASDDGIAYVIEPDEILSFSSTRTQP